MKGKKKGFLLTLAVLFVLFLVPVSTSAATKLNMATSLKYYQKGYQVIAWNKTSGRAYVYKQASFKKGVYSSLENGGAMVVNMAKVKSLTKNMKKKTLTWIPVYMNNMRNKGKMVTAYVNARSISLSLLNIKNISSNATVRKAINYGFKYLGTQFILGGTSMTNGIDCATFTKQIYEYAGKAMPYPHTDALQTVARDIPRSSLKAGDLVFYLKNDTSGPIDHVGVYLGKGLMINASGHYGTSYPQGGISIKKIVYGNRVPVRCMRLYGI